MRRFTAPRFTPGNGSQTDAVCAPSPAEPLPPARMLDVLCEQLEYLFHHARGACPPGCPQCARLLRIERQLLRPFC